MKENRSLILRSNRFMASYLLEKGMITNTDVEAANEKFMGAIQSTSTYKNTSMLKMLVHDLKAMDENVLLSHIVDEHELGLVDLDQIDLKEPLSVEMDLALCWATMTVPFDVVDQTFMLATCYYVSSPTLKYWETFLGGKVLWYATSMVSITNYLERIDNLPSDNDADPEDG